VLFVGLGFLSGYVSARMYKSMCQLNDCSLSQAHCLHFSSLFYTYSTYDFAQLDQASCYM